MESRKEIPGGMDTLNPKKHSSNHHHNVRKAVDEMQDQKHSHYNEEVTSDIEQIISICMWDFAYYDLQSEQCGFVHLTMD